MLFKIHNLYKYILTILYFFVIGFISYKTIIKNTFFLPRDLDFIFLTLSFSSPMLKSIVFPGWGEISEYKDLSKDNNIESISYIKERSKYIMLSP